MQKCFRAKLSARAKVSLYKKDPSCKSIFVQFCLNLKPKSNFRQ